MSFFGEDDGRRQDLSDEQITEVRAEALEWTGRMWSQTDFEHNESEVAESEDIVSMGQLPVGTEVIKCSGTNAFHTSQPLLWLEMDRYELSEDEIRMYEGICEVEKATITGGYDDGVSWRGHWLCFRPQGNEPTRSELRQPAYESFAVLLQDLYQGLCSPHFIYISILGNNAVQDDETASHSLPFVGCYRLQNENGDRKSDAHANTIMAYRLPNTKKWVKTRNYSSMLFRSRVDELLSSIDDVSEVVSESSRDDDPKVPELRLVGGAE